MKLIFIFVTQLTNYITCIITYLHYALFYHKLQYIILMQKVIVTIKSLKREYHFLLQMCIYYFLLELCRNTISIYECFMKL